MIRCSKNILLVFSIASFLGYPSLAWSNSISTTTLSSCAVFCPNISFAIDIIESCLLYTDPPKLDRAKINK